MQRGGRLVEIHCAAANQQVKSYLDSIDPQRLEKSRYWIGAEMIYNRDFYWVSSHTTASYIAWGSNPNKLSSETCILIDNAAGGRGWIRGACADIWFMPLCELPSAGG